MLTLIDRAQTWAETLATRPDEERLKQVRRFFEDARAELIAGSMRVASGIEAAQAVPTLYHF